MLKYDLKQACNFQSFVCNYRINNFFMNCRIFSLSKQWRGDFSSSVTAVGSTMHWAHGKFWCGGNLSQPPFLPLASFGMLGTR
jgi:hypothetical protein